MRIKKITNFLCSKLETFPQVSKHHLSDRKTIMTLNTRIIHANTWWVIVRCNRAGVHHTGRHFQNEISESPHITI